MSSSSTAVFLAALKRLNLADLWEQFENLGWTNQGEFAFAAPFVPGMPNSDETVFINEIVTPLLGDPNHKRRAAVRRLHYE